MNQAITKPAITYHVVYQEITTEYGETARTYGLQAYADGDVAAQVLDISTNPAFVHKLAKRYTKHQLSPYHLHDAVCDILE
ncbi:MAG: DUF6514 family protein [Defluviitaleaceae bacterium]|nr:DUF6514 family protein [Defluviitaleaceae bacterium]